MIAQHYPRRGYSTTTEDVVQANGNEEDVPL